MRVYQFRHFGTFERRTTIIDADNLFSSKLKICQNAGVMNDRNMSWIVYILQCADGSLYTGITTDLERRIAEHNAGTGAKYTRARLPLKLVYEESAKDRSKASKREAAIKKLGRSEKLALILSKNQGIHLATASRSR